MHLTQHTDYALRVLIYLGNNLDRLVTIAEISGRLDVSRSHLMKVANELIRSGFVEGLRGKGGGLRLAREPARIVVGDVVRVTERNKDIVECFGPQNRCLLTPACQLKGILAGALDAFMAVLDRATLADLLGPEQRPLLGPQILHPAAARGASAPALAPAVQHAAKHRRDE
ncbi:Rrf2 family transcriptional regulator [Thauera sp. CAU 1555]|uniref:Rrf2 family transcriptional regulator n=1 Tax=Thauera sedimentorum TaxID=2767595 RepID=A0ABR9B995_9RHOO|nr:Rrf2 family transcriptional regulator [Thauera sedimentorum]MBC9072011.1 Rrf2 family transcriptional regulator [Thauera sedimentorum]MBD8502930.1 Rrf2 family transcriptional regulator [Thauera sedimentorum]